MKSIIPALIILVMVVAVGVCADSKATDDLPLDRKLKMLELIDQLLHDAVSEHEVPIFRDEDGIRYFNTQALIQKLKILELRIRALEFQGCGCDR